MISTLNGVLVQDEEGRYYYLSDYRKGGTVVQWAKDALAYLPLGLVRFRAGDITVPIHVGDSHEDLFQRWSKCNWSSSSAGNEQKVILSTDCVSVQWPIPEKLVEKETK